jgi:chaperonin GroES
MQLKPLGNRAIISLLDDGSFSSQQGGIIIPDIVKGNLSQGKVLAIGDSEQSVLHVGDLTLFSENSGVAVKLNNENYLIIDEQDILAVITDK